MLFKHSDENIDLKKHETKRAFILGFSFGAFITYAAIIVLTTFFIN